MNLIVTIFYACVLIKEDVNDHFDVYRGNFCKMSANHCDISVKKLLLVYTRDFEIVI